MITGADHRLFWSASFALAAETWRQLGGFCESYDGYGPEDTDFGQLAAQCGIGHTWVGGAWAYHQYHPTSDPPAAPARHRAERHHLPGPAGLVAMQGWLRAFQDRGLARYGRGSGHLGDRGRLTSARGVRLEWRSVDAPRILASRARTGEQNWELRRCPPDAIVILKADHKRIKSLFKEFQDAGDKATKTKGKLVTKMIAELTAHTYIENECMYPRVRELLPELEDDVLESYEEHHVADVLVTELTAMTAGTSGSTRRPPC